MTRVPEHSYEFSRSEGLKLAEFQRRLQTQWAFFATGPILLLITTSLLISIMGGPHPPPPLDPFNININKTSTIILTSILLTGFFVYSAFYYKNEGYGTWKISSDLNKSGVMWPKQGIVRFIINTWRLDLWMIEGVAFIGNILSYYFLTPFFILVASFSSLSLFVLSYSRIPRLLEYHNSYLQTMDDFKNIMNSRIIYASDGLLLREQCISLRKQGYYRVFKYEELKSYGFLPHRDLYLRWLNDEKDILPMRNARVTLSTLKSVLENKKIDITYASSREINVYISEVKRKQFENLIMIISVIGMSIAFLLFWGFAIPS